MKPVLRKVGATTDCTGLIVTDNTGITSQTVLPNSILLEIFLFQKAEKLYQFITSTTDTNISEFLAHQGVLINSYVLGKTFQDEVLKELSCGILQINYYWLFTTNKIISYNFNKKEIVSNATEIPDLLLIDNIPYLINKQKSTTTKLVTFEPLHKSGTEQFVKGIYSKNYFINDCQIRKGITTAIGNLDIISCEVDSSCYTEQDKKKVDELLQDLMALKSAHIKLECGNVNDANEIIKHLCKNYANDCISSSTVISDSDSDSYSGCTSCN